MGGFSVCGRFCTKGWEPKSCRGCGGGALKDLLAEQRVFGGSLERGWETRTPGNGTVGMLMCVLSRQAEEPERGPWCEVGEATWMGVRFELAAQNPGFKLLYPALQHQGEEKNPHMACRIRYRFPRAPGQEGARDV